MPGPESTDLTVIDRIVALLRRRSTRLPRNIEFESPAAANRFRQRVRSAAADESAQGGTVGSGTDALGSLSAPSESASADMSPLDTGIEPGTQVICPRCRTSAALEPLICSACGFPFICDITPVDRKRVARRSLSWRVALGAAALIFWLTNVALVAAGTGEYQGQTTRVVAGLDQDIVSGIPISGPEAFVVRTKLALDLMRQRAPDVYYRMRSSVSSIDYLDRAWLEDGDRRITLEGIGAVATPSTGQVQVLMSTAFPSGASEFWDADVFSYAGVLIHELRHIELHAQGNAPGGWEEEVLCELAAYEVLQQMDAPGAIMARYQAYLSNPHAKRYQSWYDWYDQF